MGAQESAARSREEQLEIGQEFSSSSGLYKIWDHVNPCTKNKKVKGTIFTKKWDGSAETKKYIENGVTLLKQLRHPGVLTFLECSQRPDSLSLMTEQVQVLDLCIETLSFVEIHSGLCQILEILLFLHEKAKICHRSISPSSIFVALNGEFKLGGFELAQSLAAADDAFLKSQFYKRVKNDKFAPDMNSNMTGVERDCYAFGRLIDYTLSQLPSNETDSEELIQALKETAEKLMNTEERCSLLSLKSHFAFSNDLSQITDFFSTIQIKSQEEKELFYRDIEQRLRCLPAAVVARRLCRLAVSRYVILEPLSHEHLYPLLLTPAGENTNGILPLDLFESHLIPEVVRVFAVKETSVRLGLLAHFDRYVQHIPTSLLEGFVLDEVLKGSRDLDSRLVAASLRAMADLVDLLGADRVCDWKLSKLFVDGTAKTSRPVSAKPLAAPKEEEKRRPVSVSSSQPVRHQDSGYSSAVSPPKTKERISLEREDDQTAWGEADDWSDNWNEPNDDYNPEAHSPEPAAAAPIRLASQPKATVKKENSIGASLEIKAAKTQEDDFFADMAPEIKTGGTLIDKLIAMKEKEQTESRKEVRPSKFDMAADLNEEAADWGEDSAWGDEQTAEDGETPTREGLEENGLPEEAIENSRNLSPAD